MINKLTYIESTGVNPYKNLAMEEYLFSHCGEDEAILYLWQNQHTIVIGQTEIHGKSVRSAGLKKMVQ